MCLHDMLRLFLEARWMVELHESIMKCEMLPMFEATQHTVKVLKGHTLWRNQVSTSSHVLPL